MLELKNTLNKLRIFNSKYHYTVFLVLAVCGIVAGIYSLLTVVQSSADLQPAAPTTNTSVDTATIERIRNLKDKSSANIELPTDQRINLFDE